MYCPYCNHQNHLEINLHADGYSTALLECASCGALLRTNPNNMETVYGPDRKFFAHKIMPTQS